MAHELRALLQGAGLAGPYVLVGHSLGGLNARLFASEYAADVRGPFISGVGLHAER
jgi:pimeloyl-ACP methyl ester carboxylesterase